VQYKSSFIGSALVWLGPPFAYNLDSGSVYRLCEQNPTLEREWGGPELFGCLCVGPLRSGILQLLTERILQRPAILWALIFIYTSLPVRCTTLRRVYCYGYKLYSYGCISHFVTVSACRIQLIPNRLQLFYLYHCPSLLPGV